MERAETLISDRIVIGMAVDRLADVAPQIKKLRAQHIVVLHELSRDFLGLVNLPDIVGRSDIGNRILADLIPETKPVVVGPAESAQAIAVAFEQYQLGEAVLLDNDGAYLGLITAQSVVAWLLAAHRRIQTELQGASKAKDRFINAISHELRTPLTPALLISTAHSENQNLSEDLRRDFRMIAKHLTQESKLISDLIDLAALTRPSSSVPTTPESGANHARLSQRINHRGGIR